MSEELERLEAALGADVPEPPRETRERAIAAAMSAFDRQQETMTDGGHRSRWAGWAGATFGSLSRGLASPNSNTYLAFAGAAAFALVAVVVVYLLPLSQLLPMDAEFPEASDAAKAGEATQLDAPHVGEARSERTQRESIALPEVVAETPYAPAADAAAVSAPSAAAADAVRATARDMKSIASERGARGSSPREKLPGRAQEAMAYEEIALHAPPADTGVRVHPAAPAAMTLKQAREGPPQRGYRDQGRDQFADFETNPVKIVAEEPVSTFSIDVDTASYGFVRASLNNGLLPQKNAVRVEELINYFPYDYTLPEDRETPFAASVSVLPAPWNAASRLLHIGIRGYAADDPPTRRANLVFLVDTSGSMQAPNKLPLLVNSLKMLLEALAPDDRVAIVTYAGSASVLLEPTRVEEKGRIAAALERLSAGGFTAGGEGIRQAYLLAGQHHLEDGINRVILATDGDFNVGITDPEELTGFIERQRAGGVFLSVLGFGMGNYNDALMQRLAQNGNGNALYIDSLSEARKALVEEARSMLFPIAKDVKIQVEFNPAAVSEYRLIGYETRLLEREDFRNDRVDAGEIGAGHRVTAIYEFTPAGSGAERIAPLRYRRGQATEAGPGDELAFLKIRYKLPDAEESTLMTRPVTAADAVADVAAAPDDVRFASAVAAFGQILRGGRYTGGYGYDDVIALAQGARGEDRFGYRAEFIGLARLAESAAAMPPLQR
ncbi:MAG: VWA domain-containing protein [Gammaproteobacteria bacterium]|nr:VWA domain-containing protein [Gammaproteobacteria bacterium]